MHCMRGFTFRLLTIKTKCVSILVFLRLDAFRMHTEHGPGWGVMGLPLASRDAGVKALCAREVVSVDGKLVSNSSVDNVSS